MSDTDNRGACYGDQADPANIVIIGAAGDLSKRKLMPALFKMVRCGLIHPQSRIIGVANSRSMEEWQALVRGGLDDNLEEAATEEEWLAFATMLKIVGGNLEDAETYQHLADSLEVLEGRKNAMFYCAIPPQWYGVTANGLKDAGLVDDTEGYRRIVIEKPIGTDLASAKALNRELQEVFDESQIYRIDHYLGKESVQNLLVYRFANSIMEPLWNRNYIDHIQIFAAETLGIEYRANYYEKSGALRDMIQSHLLQVMTLVCMEPPVEFSADAIRDEKIKVLRAVRRLDPDNDECQAVAAQYASGTIDDEKVPAYVSEADVSPDSATETFAAVRFYIDNWRWQGVPIILWTGKRMQRKASEVMIRFRKPPFNLFDSHATEPLANALVFRLQPDEGIVLRMNAKMPGLSTDIQRMVMRAPYAKDGKDVSEAYEILLHDVLNGDATLFSHADEIEESWDIVAPLIDNWKDRFSIERYRAGSWDVPDMDDLLKDCVGGWHKPS
ncbi:MAG: glucose-6-phosphate dehydrogenase [Gammaproteobacteria bacterium]|nr:glucose-6-phosphate dehydrogenase [Gammaproteobacteria bacterium]